MLVARRFDAGAILCLSNLTNVLAPTINKKVTNTAHIAIVEHRCPELGGQDEVSAVSGKPPQVHVAFQVQNLALPTGCEGGPSAVYRDGACSEGWGGLEIRYRAALKPTVEKDRMVMSARNHTVYTMMEVISYYSAWSEHKKAFGVLFSVLKYY